MEQFKKLKWSWEIYEEEKKKDPRVYSFETIADRDPLSRTLNEVHLCVLPAKSQEYRFLKTQEEIEANTFDSRGLIAEVLDPRKSRCKVKLKQPHELVKDYGYSSELTLKEQTEIIQSLGTNSVYNQNITKNLNLFKDINRNSTISLELMNKWKKEIEQFNKCAEIYYYRHISELNNLISDDIESFLLKEWNLSMFALIDQKYQVITMILRQKTWTLSSAMSVDFIKNYSQDFDQLSYVIPANFFTQIQHYSIESLKLYSKHHQHYSSKEQIINEEKFDIKLSLDVLAKLFIDENNFFVTFTNSNDGTCFKSDVVPSKTVNQNEALQEAVRRIVLNNIEWFNINNNNYNATSHAKEDFHAQKIDDFMGKIYAGFKDAKGHNMVTSLFKMSKNELHLNLLASGLAFYQDGNTISVSIKLEYQTKFGAEKMTKEELLKEWISLKFLNTSQCFRFRIDARTLIVLSISQISIEDIEKELKENYECDPSEFLELLFNTLNSLKNLPHGDYMIESRDNKFYIYKENYSQGKIVIGNDDISIASTFNRKWVPIDEKFPTYIHLNLKIAPCCFPISFAKNKKATSYTIRKKIIKQKVPVVVKKTKPVIGKTKKKNKNKKKKKKIVKVVQ